MPDPLDTTAAIAEPVDRFVRRAARTALSAPAAGPSPPPVGLTTVVVVEPGEGVEVPPGAEPAASEPSAAARGTKGAARRPAGPARMSLEVQLGDRRVMLRPTEDAMWGYVTQAFKLGGFDQVVRARQAIDAAVAEFEEQADQAKAAADDAAEARDVEEQQISADQAGPGPEAYRLRDQASETARKSGETRAHADSVQWFKFAFNGVWAQLAVIEEAWLREWETVAFPELLRIMDAHMKRADEQWKRYGVYLADKPSTTAKIDESEGLTAKLRLNLNRENDPSTSSSGTTSGGTTSGGTSSGSGSSGSALPSLRDLWKRANDLRNYAQTTIPKAIENAMRTAQGSDTSEAQRLAAHVEDLSNDWKNQLHEVETTDPVLLQIYRDVTTQTKLDKIETLVIDALLAAYFISKDVHDHAVRLLPAGTTRRITPSQTTDPKKPHGLTDAQQTVVASAGSAASDAVALGLVIPASVALGVELTQSTSAKNSVWLHQAVRVTTDGHLEAQRLANLPRGALVELGSLAYAAKTHAFDEFEALRQHDKERFGTWSMIVLTAGVLLIPFTAGSSMAAVGMVTAAFQIAAFVEEAERVEDASALSRSTLNALETTLWTRPSQVKLVRLALATAIDVGQTILAGEIPLLIDLLIMAASWGIRPDEQETGHGPAPAGQPASAGGE